MAIIATDSHYPVDDVTDLISGPTQHQCEFTRILIRRAEASHANHRAEEVDLAAQAFSQSYRDLSMPRSASSRRLFASRKSSCCLFGIVYSCGKLFIAHLAR